MNVSTVCSYVASIFVTSASFAFFIINFEMIFCLCVCGTVVVVGLHCAYAKQ